MNQEKKYAHPLEKDFAEILQREGVTYEYGKLYKVRNGEGIREVDFVLKKETKTTLSDELLKHLELKSGGKSAHTKQQQEDLAGAGIHTFIVDRQKVKFCKKFGFLDRKLVPVPVLV